jgi:hypothetical protein
MAINIYPAAFEFSVNAKNNYDIIFFAQRCSASLVYDSDMTLCPSSTQQFSFIQKCHTAVVFLSGKFYVDKHEH